MSHQISITNGVASYADSKADSKGRTNAWHKLGTPVGHEMTGQEALEAAHLANWNVRKRPIWADIREDGGEVRGITVPGQFATVFDNPVTKAITPLGVVGNRFTPIQNEALTGFADALVDESGAHFQTAGSLRDYTQTFLTMKLPQTLILTGKEGQDITEYYLGLFNSHDGNSALFGVITPVRVVCHAVGTPVLHKGQWIPVEEHPGVMSIKHEVGRSIRVAGLPFSETVTWDHRYWGRKVGKKSFGWIFAGDMTPKGHEIATPIDRTVENVREYWNDDRAVDPRWWWALGNLWADGNVQHPRSPGSQGKVTFSVTKQAAKNTVFALLKERGFTGKGTNRGSHMQITVADDSLHNLFRTFYRDWKDGGKTSGKGAMEKLPPTWIERIDPDLQAAFVRGYLDGDGSVDKTKGGEIVESVSLDGLLSLRRILARLGTTSLVRKGGKRTGVIMGRAVNDRQSWSLRIPGSPDTSLVRIEGDWLVSRVSEAEDGVEAMFVPLDIPEDDHQYVSHFGLSHNCANTAAVAIAGAHSRFSIPHTSGWKNSVEAARQKLGLTLAYQESFEVEVNKLFDQEFSDESAKLFSEKLVGLSEVEEGSVAATKRQNEANAIYTLFVDSPTIKGTVIAGTKFGAFNAVTEYVDHFQGVRGGGDDPSVARATRTLTQAATGGGLKAQAWSLLKV